MLFIVVCRDIMCFSCCLSIVIFLFYKLLFRLVSPRGVRLIMICLKIDLMFYILNSVYIL